MICCRACEHWATMRWTRISSWAPCTRTSWWPNFSTSYSPTCSTEILCTRSKKCSGTWTCTWSKFSIYNRPTSTRLTWRWFSTSTIRIWNSSSITSLTKYCTRLRAWSWVNRTRSRSRRTVTTSPRSWRCSSTTCTPTSNIPWICITWMCITTLRIYCTSTTWTWTCLRCCWFCSCTKCICNCCTIWT